MLRRYTSCAAGIPNSKLLCSRAAALLDLPLPRDSASLGKRPLLHRSAWRSYGWHPRRLQSDMRPPDVRAQTACVSAQSASTRLGQKLPLRKRLEPAAVTADLRRHSPNSRTRTVTWT